MPAKKFKNIAIIGTGYVGLVTGACFAELGHQVTACDSDEQKIRLLQKGKSPIYEPYLEKLISKNQKAKRLIFVETIYEPIRPSSIVFICVGTPPLKNGEADLSAVENVGQEIAKNLNAYKLIIEKSTVPVQTGFWLEKILKINSGKNIDFDVASNPEFLREGQAISDTLHPDRIVIGTRSKKAQDLLIELHKSIDGTYVLTNIETAEMIKYASNAFLATKISFANAIAYLSELTGADGLKVLGAVGFDKRVGSAFLSPGVGYGGSCFPKDVKR